ncbi:hypothetical protein A5791_19830 [Mycobacterium sp. 852002-51163_SCH5372311]|uniref:hypothetical protein n=1 Tax=Mycobacterium sp. 852002-51163_SCH5372311 TaxID=1834097 RepID=UPI0007FDE66F|nr:hypothetical protein [Mycobacterium sp. 852002-51163_SCH5372311]OBF86948.1 hypothetical protein A5791_19830 [Mycobacterium sp. 852002-51163_SCH5372311]
MTSIQERLTAIEQELLPQEYHTAKKVAEETRRLITTPPSLPSAAQELDPFTIGEIREEWIDAQIDRKDAEARLERRRGVLIALASQAQGQAAAVSRSIRNEVLAGFHRELERLLDDAAEVVAELGDVSSAQEAIASDRGPAWKRLCELADDYATLRRFQLARIDDDIVTRSKPTAGGEEHASDLYIRNLDDVWREWRTGGARNGVTVTNVRGPAPRYEPWPASQPLLLRWLVTSPAEPWVPTPEQLQQHWADRQQRANPQPTTLSPPTERGDRLKNVTHVFARTAKTIESAKNATAGGF